MEDSLKMVGRHACVGGQLVFACGGTVAPPSQRALTRRDASSAPQGLLLHLTSFCVADRQCAACHLAASWLQHGCAGLNRGRVSPPRVLPGMRPVACRRSVACTRQTPAPPRLAPTKPHLSRGDDAIQRRRPAKVTPATHRSAMPCVHAMSTNPGHRPPSCTLHADVDPASGAELGLAAMTEAMDRAAAAGGQQRQGCSTPTWPG